MSSSGGGAGRAPSRLLEVLAVVLLGVATIGSAWCGYQATRWNGEESELARASGVLQVEAARQFGLATQVVSYDTNTISQYANALAAGNEQLERFYRDTLIRPDFLPILDEWEAQAVAGSTPANLLEDEEYLETQLGPYRETQTRAAERAVEAEQAGAEADDYVLTTLILASALFFAGLTTSFRVRFAQVLLLTGSSLLIAFAASRLAELDIA